MCNKTQCAGCQLLFNTNNILDDYCKDCIQDSLDKEQPLINLVCKICKRDYIDKDPFTNNKNRLIFAKTKESESVKKSYYCKVIRSL